MNGKAKALLNIFYSPFIAIGIFNAVQIIGVCRYLPQLPNDATRYSCAENEKNLFLYSQTWVSKPERNAYGSANSKPNYLGYNEKMRPQEKPKTEQGTNRIVVMGTWEKLDGSIIVASGQVP